MDWTPLGRGVRHPDRQYGACGLWKDVGLFKGHIWSIARQCCRSSWLPIWYNYTPETPRLCFTEMVELEIGCKVSKWHRMSNDTKCQMTRKVKWYRMSNDTKWKIKRNDTNVMKCQMSMSIYDSKQKRPALHTSERTIVPRTVIFSSEGALIAITPYDYPQRSAHFLSTHRSSTTTWT